MSRNKVGFNLETLIKEKYDVSFTKEELNYIYNQGVKKCEIGDFQNALTLFQFLTLLRPGVPLYLKSVASCLQHLEKYLEAYMHYQSAFIVDIKQQQDCLFFMGFCAIKIQKEQQAVELLTSFLENNPGHEFEKKAQVLLSGLKKE